MWDTLDLNWCPTIQDLVYMLYNSGYTVYNLYYKVLRTSKEQVCIGVIDVTLMLQSNSRNPLYPRPGGVRYIASAFMDW